jgi:hypothetical protein
MVRRKGMYPCDSDARSNTPRISDLRGRLRTYGPCVLLFEAWSVRKGRRVLTSPPDFEYRPSLVDFPIYKLKKI